MFSQVDDEGDRFVLFGAIIDHRAEGSEVKPDDDFIISANGSKRRRQTTKRWQILIQ